MTLSFGALAGLVILGTFVLIVLSAVIGVWRDKRQVGAADDPALERARAQAYIESQRHEGYHGGDH